MYIDNQQDFEKFLNFVSKQGAVAIDTEFIRESTYWPKLCLLQMCCADKYAIIDPFKVDIMPIKSILKNKNIVKVFHAPRQDIEILHHKTKIMPEPIFDTQTAASFLGHTIQIGYGNLVHSELGVWINKSDSYTDWSFRPLSKSQIKYAKEDVTYLIKLYYKMRRKLRLQHREHWVEQDSQKFMDVSVYDVDPYECYKHLKRASCLKGKEIAAAREVAAWREKTAVKKNLPRRWVMTDEQVVESCKKKPKNLNQLFMIRGIKNHISTQNAREILAAIQKGLKVKDEEIPKLGRSDINWDDSKIPDCGINSVLDLMTSLVRIRAYEHNLAPQVLTSNTELSMIAHGMKDGVKTLQGWRYDIIGKELLDLLNGNISLKVKDNIVQVNKVNDKPLHKHNQCILGSDTDKKIK